MEIVGFDPKHLNCGYLLSESTSPIPGDLIGLFNLMRQVSHAIFVETLQKY